MNNFWSRLSAKAKERVLIVALYLVWILVMWFGGKKHLATPAEAFFGLAALTGVYAGLYVFVKTKILGK